MLSQYYLQIGIARVNVPGSTYSWYWTTNFGSTDDGTGGGSPAPTATPTSTATPAPPTATPTNTAVPTATNTPGAQPTNTPTPSNGGGSPAPTATPTSTVKPPTSTPTPGSTQPKASTPTATATPAASTRTPTPVATPTPGSLLLSAGANLVGWPGGNLDADDALEPLANVIAVVYRWDNENGTWERYAPGLPPYVNSLRRVVQGEAYWVITR